MLIYGYSTARWELWLLATPQRWLIAAGLLAAGLLAARGTRRSPSTPSPHLIYEETPDDAVQQLGLSRPV